MIIQIPESVEAELSAIARQRASNSYMVAAELLSHAIHEITPSLKDQPSVDELLAGFVKLAGTATPVKDYPSDFFSRDAIYADHE